MDNTNITFSQAEKDVIVRKIKLYFSEELQQQIGGFDAEFLLDFFAKEIGAYFYNRGLYDAQAALASKIDDIQDAIFQLERPTEFQR
ncbi:DUF2164 domain-containing protein [Dyella psychrodurans]|uniref:DUF2164 domain-containing protein n=1 Tax=Dyella psychrodurans TaxID=1927960 RepID=A0A370X238_9GAMM|nr:DUF2164 domain-containing protein [Dyella psychrodurans]RDS82422.1 DUF2164 domain-containing protein [Dyella psychrodurans]